MFPRPAPTTRVTMLLSSPAQLSASGILSISPMSGVHQTGMPALFIISRTKFTSPA
ncbi:MAG: hypothetical protein Q8P50_05230 [Bacillota bacterium]|nr:hypothetical protein [Bacillota bacterium]